MKIIPIRQIDTAQHEYPSPGRFKIRRVEDLLDREDLFHELHRHDFFFIIALRKGDGTHEIDFTTYTVSDYSVFIMGPGRSYFLQGDVFFYIFNFLGKQNFFSHRFKQE
jgi:hypothetical protein